MASNSVNVNVSPHRILLSSMGFLLIILTISSGVFGAPAKHEKNPKSRELVAIDSVSQKNTGIVASGTPIFLTDAGSGGVPMSSGGQATQAILLTTTGSDQSQAIAVPVASAVAVPVSVSGQSQVTNINTYKTQ